jgi:Zn-finger nucleic acid-binding protein
MDCPVCKNTKLVITERQSIEIDYCPNCRGVWLDRGELDKIIDRASGPAAAPNPPAAQYPRQEYAAPVQRPAYPPEQHHSHYKKKRREGFLGELFDFD